MWWSWAGVNPSKAGPVACLLFEIYLSGSVVTFRSLFFFSSEAAEPDEDALLVKLWIDVCYSLCPVAGCVRGFYWIYYVLGVGGGHYTEILFGFLDSTVLSNLENGMQRVWKGHSRYVRIFPPFSKNFLLPPVVSLVCRSLLNFVLKVEVRIVIIMPFPTSF